MYTVLDMLLGAILGVLAGATLLALIAILLMRRL